VTIDLERYVRKFPNLVFLTPEAGIIELVISNEGRLNAATEAMHGELAAVWPAFDKDDAVRTIIVRGERSNFSSGGDFTMIERIIEDEATLIRVWKEASALVYNMINCYKPVVSAIRGSAVGAGLAIALLADISVAAENARILDGHTRLGVAAGDHAVIIWPLLCGLAKARYQFGAFPKPTKPPTPALQGDQVAAVRGAKRCGLRRRVRARAIARPLWPAVILQL
jgi:enoyl-CoA hydratase